MKNKFTEILKGKKVKGLLIVGAIATIGFVAKALRAKDDQDEEVFDDAEEVEIEYETTEE